MSSNEDTSAMMKQLEAARKEYQKLRILLTKSAEARKAKREQK